jgi:F0F1-type ATP synthase epsilon subunit
MDTEIDLDRAEAARKWALEEIDKAKGAGDVAFVEVALKRAIIRIRAGHREGAGG